MERVTLPELSPQVRQVEAAQLRRPLASATGSVRTWSPASGAQARSA